MVLLLVPVVSQVAEWELLRLVVERFVVALLLVELAVVAVTLACTCLQGLQALYPAGLRARYR